MWTGQRYDAGVRLYHFLHRTFNPGLGRWLQRDPLGYVDGVNLYEYVGGNPLTWVDPLGLLQEQGWRLDIDDHGGPHIQLGEDRWSAVDLKPIKARGRTPRPLKPGDIEDLRRLGIIDEILEKVPDSRIIEIIRKIMEDAIEREVRTQLQRELLKHKGEVWRLTKSAGKKLSKKIVKSLPAVTLIFFVDDARAKGIKYAAVNTVIPTELVKELDALVSGIIEHARDRYIEEHVRMLRIQRLMDAGYTEKEAREMLGL